VRFAKIFFDAPVPLEISRISDGRLLEVNESFAQLFGYARDELIGHTSVEMGMFSPAEEREKIRHKLKADGCLRDEEMSTYNRSGEMVQVLISAVPLIMNGEECVLGTLLDITERKKAEEMRENLIGQLNTAQEQQRMLSARLMAAQETERRVIARELHDEVGQALTALKINLQTAQRKLNNGMDLAESIAMVENTLQQVRTISLNLPPTVLEDLGLVPALRWLLDRQGREAGFSTSFITDIGEVRLDPQIEIACFRVAQEALTNVMRHAHAQHVNMTLEKINKELHLTVHDDGKGYDVEAAYQRAWHGNSLGLVGMQERVVLAGGRMEIESGPGKGTRIHASFPLARSQPDDGEGGKLP
jgi:PAS domain S-box-containing protein